MLHTLTLVAPDEVLSVDVLMSDHRAFERQGRRDVGAPLGGTLSDAREHSPMGFLLWVTWHALKRTGQVTESYASMEARAADVEVTAGTEEPVDPTGPGR